MELIKHIGERINRRWITLATRVGGAPSPLGVPPYLVSPLELHRPQLQLYIFVFGKKKPERRIHHVL